MEQLLHGVEAITEDVEVFRVGGIVDAQAFVEGGTGPISRFGSLTEGHSSLLHFVGHELLSGVLRGG